MEEELLHAKLRTQNYTLHRATQAEPDKQQRNKHEEHFRAHSLPPRRAPTPGCGTGWLRSTDWLWNGRLRSTTTITGHPPLATGAEQRVLESLVRGSGEDSREEAPPATTEHLVPDI